MYFFIAIANVFISIPLIKVMGEIGAALGTTISLIMGNILFMNWYYHNRIGINIWFFWKKIAGFVPSLIIPCIVGYLEMKFINYESFLSLGIAGMLYVFVYCAFIYRWGMNKDEKVIISGILRGVSRK